MKNSIAFICLCLALNACGGQARTAPPVTSPAPADTSPAVVAPTRAASPATPAAAPAVTPISAPTDAPTETPPESPTQAARQRATATSAGPLDFQVYVAGCRAAPTAEKPDNVVLTLSVEASGGNGAYRYIHREVEQTSKFVDVEWAKNTRLVGKIAVRSGDGQALEKEYDFRPSDYCP